jgi:hypothetical protein
MGLIYILILFVYSYQCDKTILRWCTQHQLIISTNWWFTLYDSFSVFTGICKYQVINKTDKYILIILEHNHLQNTMFTLLQLCIQDQHDINRYSCKYRKWIIKCKSPIGRYNQLMLCTSSSYCFINCWDFHSSSSSYFVDNDSVDQHSQLISY